MFQGIRVAIVFVEESLPLFVNGLQEAYREQASADLPPPLAPLAAECMPFYDELAAHRIRL